MKPLENRVGSCVIIVKSPNSTVLARLFMPSQTQIYPLYVRLVTHTHMDPPLETSGNFKSSSIFNSPIKPKKPVPHVQATHDKHKGRDTEN